MPVNSQHPDYRRMIDRWIRCRDVADGQDAVHTAGEKYLPMLIDQTPTEYKAYKERGVFYNATWRTIAGLVGMVFRKPPIVTVPATVEDLLKDVTLSGVPFQMFAQEVTEEALKLGRLGVLVDYPPVDTVGLTMADAAKLNLRPTMALYRAESIINWKCDRVNNIWSLTQVVLKEMAPIYKDEFTTTTEDRYRALDLFGGKYRQRLFRMKEGGIGEEQIGGDLYPLMAGKPLDYIPFTFLSADDNTAEIDEPPLIDLVNVNLSHYRSTADLEHGAHFTGLPTPVVSGHTPEKDGEKLYIGSTSAWVFKDPQAKAAYLEFTGVGLEALEKRLEVKEKQMAVLGARMLEQQKRAVQTAETETIHRKGEESMLSSTAQSLSLGLERVLKWWAEWAGADVSADGAIECELNREFYPQQMTDKMITALVAAWQQGGISFQTLFENLQSGDVIDAEKTVEDEQAQIGTTPPALQGQGTDPVTGEPAAPAKLSKEKKQQSGPRSAEITNPKGEKYKITY